jgi:hypothetical protein
MPQLSVEKWSKKFGEAFMNEYDQPAPPPIIPASPGPEDPFTQRKPRPFSWWLRKLFACNPFYLVSAALLLYGCYRVLIDPSIFTQESTRLLFNFSSVQVYEVLLVFTAIFLARRSLWYDSTLLVGLENLLVFVPFILISQAAFIDSQLAWTMSLVGAGMAMARFGSLKRFFTQLNLPGRALVLGLGLLTVNVALPLIYRHFGETKVGVLDSGPAYEMNEYTWLLILPAVLAVANFLPPAFGSGVLLPQHRWLPSGLFALWPVATGVHVYCLDYIYQFDLRPELLAPLAWVLAWTVWRRFPDTNVWLHWVKYTLVSLPLLISFWAVTPGNKTFLALNALNIVAYAMIGFVVSNHRLARQLLHVSVLMFFAGLPDAWLPFVTPNFDREEYVATGVMAYMIFWALIKRDPRLAIFGSILFGYVIATMCEAYDGCLHWAFQGAFIFFLLHSLRWDDAKHVGAKMVRYLAALSWVMQSFLWVEGPGKFWMPCIPALFVLAVYCIALFRRGHLVLSVIPAAALLVFISGPSSTAFDRLTALPTGPLAVIISFILFALGTLAALTRSHWHKVEPARETKPVDVAGLKPSEP